MFDEDLVVVGTGIRTLGQLTVEAIAWIRRADHVLHVVSDPVGQETISHLNERNESLSWMYRPDEPRITTYGRMVERVLQVLRERKTVCFAAYGHPGVFAWPTHESVRRARAEGYRARMLPGISAEDCLFADLGIDPASAGCQSYEATDFLLNRRVIDPTSHVILWQIGALGQPSGAVVYGARARGLPLLVARLREDYPKRHRVHLYEAALLPGAPPRVQAATVEGLPALPMGTATTLYVPPARRPRTDWKLARALGYERPAGAG